MFSLLYLAITRRLVAAILLTIGLFIPFLNFVVMIVLFIWGGLQGRSWLESDTTLSAQQRKTYGDFFDRLGLYFFRVAVIMFVIWMLVVLLGLSMGGLFMNSSETQMQGMEFLQDLEQMQEMQQQQ